jgi:DNA-directed RNA polymerase specialized sigma24 family protein
MEAQSDCERRCEPATGPVGCRRQTDCLFAIELARLQTQKFRFLRSRGVDAQTAEDIVGRAVEKMLGVNTPIVHLAAYFHQVVIREQVTLFRRIANERRIAPLFVVPEGVEDIHEDFEYQQRRAVLRALKGVSEVSIQLAELRWVFGWSTDDLMELTGLSRDAIDQHISRVRRAARKARDRGEF